MTANAVLVSMLWHEDAALSVYLCWLLAVSLVCLYAFSAFLAIYAVVLVYLTPLSASLPVWGVFAS